MADSCESESEEEQPKKALDNLNERQRSSEKDLQTIFKKLRVDSDGLVVNTFSLICFCRRNEKPPHFLDHHKKTLRQD